MEPARPPRGERSARGSRAAAILVLALVGACPRGAEAQFQTKVGSLLVPTTGPNQSITGIGFTPRAVIFFWTAQTVGGFVTNVSAGYGFATAAGSERAVSFVSDDNLDANNPARWQWTNRCIAVVANAAAVATDAHASLTSMDVDGFSLNWPVRNTAYIIHYLALGGPDITDAAVGSFTPTAGLGSQSVGGLAFSPQFLMFLSIDSNTTASRVTPDGKVTVGYAGLSNVHGITQGVNEATSRTTIATANIITDGMQRTNVAIVEKNPGVGGGALTFEAAVTSFDANGFTLNKTDNDGGTETTIHYLALRGGQYRVGEVRRPAAAGASLESYSSVGFGPQGLIFQSYNLTNQTVPDEEARLSFSAADSTFSGTPLRPNQRATFLHDKIDAPSDSDFSWARQATSGSAGVNGKLVYLAQAGDCPPRWPEGVNPLMCSAGPRLITDADLASYDRLGFTLSWTANDLANMNQNPGDEMNAQVLYVAFGPPAPQTNYRSIGAAGNVGGTLNATNGSALVSDPSATWVTANRGRGDLITIGGTPYVVLGVNSETQLTLTTAFAAASGPYAYTIARQFGTLAAWEDCVDGLGNGGSCPAFAPASNDLRADHRREVGIAYDDSVGSDFVLAANVVIDGSVTDATHTITLTADGGNRHYGTPGAGVVVDANLTTSHLNIQDANVTIEWLELKGLRGTAGNALIRVVDGGTTNILLQNLLLHDYFDPTTLPTVVNQGAIRLSGTPGKSVTVRNVMVWDGDNDGIRGDEAGDALTIDNCTIDDVRDSSGNPRRGVFADQQTGVVVRNTIATRSGTDFDTGSGSFAATSTNNTSADGSAPGPNPQTVAPAGLDALYVTPGSDLHLEVGAVAVDTGVSLSGFSTDIDFGVRPSGAGWDRGADEFGATTAVELAAFSATAADTAVELQWETSSELSNLGFHLYRASSASGPYLRLNSSLIPGLGSSPSGARYAYSDVGLVNGVTYFYELEDVEATGRTKRHGPVSATPQAGALAPASPAPKTPRPSPSVLTFGDPQAVSLQVVRRGARGVEIELETRGFYATPEADGSVRLEIPGFEVAGAPGTPAIPVERALLEAVAGRRVRIASVAARDVVGFASLRPAAAEAPEIVVRRDGTVRAGRRRAQAAWHGRGLYPEQAARVVTTAFQGEVKKALVELAPLRWDAASGQLLLARRLRVRLVFAGREKGETALGGSRGRAERGRREGRGRGGEPRLAAYLLARERGLYGVGFEQVFPGRRRPVLASELRLARLGQDVAFHLEPDASRFGPGSQLFFLSEGGSLSAYANEAVYELAVGTAGTTMPVASASPSGSPLGYGFTRQVWEQNRSYIAGLLEAPDLWLWDSLLSGTRKSYTLALSGVAVASEPATLGVWLQGASDFDAAPDHHVRVYVNGAFVTEASWDGKTARRLSAPVSPGILQEGENLLELENVGDTAAAYSMVYLDRISLDYPHTLAAELGRFEAGFSFPGSATLGGLGAGSVALDTTEAASPRWLSGTLAGGTSLSLGIEAGHRYLAVSPQALLAPGIRWPSSSDLRSTENQADYLLVAPREFLAAAAPLLQLRQQQGLRARAVALEEIFDLFGHGERSAEAIRDFLAYAYHRWSSPSPRYVLLLGDATYDPKDYAGGGAKDRIPAFMFKSSYLWTATDPAYAAVNGDDDLPDIAVGRLSAASLAEAESLVQKLVAFEASGFDLSGPAVLVADNADQAGNFEQNADEIAAGLLAGHATEKIYLSQLGSAPTRSAILAAFDRGASLMSYIGHGGTAVWASENVLNSWDAAKLAFQPQQPLLFTMNCLNGYFLPPVVDSLSEALVKAEGKGAIAAFSPSGLSLDDAAHLYHKALLGELLSGRHARLGDAILAAQSDYAATGAFPELVRIYNLLGDPALRLQ